MPVICPPRPVRPAAPPVADRVAVLYPVDLPSAQRLLAVEAVRTLRDAGTPAWVGSYDLHATCDVPVPGGRLVLVPMARLWDLDPALAAEDDADPAVWHVMARDPSGGWVDDSLPGWGCPSVLWAVRAGIDPACAVDLVQAALADPRLALLLASGGAR
jgi:hypothetical protein